MSEAIVDPQRPIIDPHHHLWRFPQVGDYLLPDLWSDTGSGHNIVKTVFIECGAEYLKEGPKHLRPVGETRFVAEQARASAVDPAQATIAGIVARADLCLGAAVQEVLDAHEEAGQGLFRGIRHAGASEPHHEALSIPGRAPADLYQDSGFIEGVRHLGQRGYTYDTWQYHHQLPVLIDLARAVPGTTFIIDHFSTPLGVGPYAGKADSIFAQWQLDFAELAKCPNVVAKLGGLAMPDNGFGWNAADNPPDSDTVLAAQRRWYEHALDCFGADRCMFESNFPVDKRCLEYAVYWNAMKKLVADASEAEQSALFHDTAARIYRL